METAANQNIVIRRYFFSTLFNSKTSLKRVSIYKLSIEWKFSDNLKPLSSTKNTWRRPIFIVTAPHISTFNSPTMCCTDHLCWNFYVETSLFLPHLVITSVGSIFKHHSFWWHSLHEYLGCSKAFSAINDNVPKLLKNTYLGDWSHYTFMCIRVSIGCTAICVSRTSLTV